MMTVIDANLLPILIALAIGLAIGWWMFRRGRAVGTSATVGRNEETAARDRVEAPPPPAARPPGRRPIRDGIDTPEGRGHEGRGIADQGAAATADVAGHVLGVEAHAEIPGAAGPPDDLQLLKGVGPKLVHRLNECGLFRFEQLARLSPNEVAMLDDRLGPFRGRLVRDRVVEQAAYLARGDTDGFEARFGKLGSGA